MRGQAWEGVSPHPHYQGALLYRDLQYQTGRKGTKICTIKCVYNFYIYIYSSLLNIPVVLTDIQCGLPTMAMVRTASLHARLALKGPRRPRGHASPTGGRFSRLQPLGPSALPARHLLLPGGPTVGSKPRSQSWSSGLPACGGLGAHHPPTTRLSARPFPKKGGKGQPSLATVREGAPSKGPRIISGSECQEGRADEGSRQRPSTTAASAGPPSERPQEAAPWARPTPVLSFPTTNTPRPPTRPPPCFPSHPAGPQLLPTSHLLHRMCPPAPQGSPLLVRRLLLLAGDCPWVT